MENGELLASEVLPKVAKEMKAVAAVGLESKLDTLRVAQGQFFNELEKSGKAIFDGGFAEGLKEVFQTLTTFLRENQSALKGFGRAFQLVFNFIEGTLKVILPIISAVGNTFNLLAEAMDNAFGDEAVKHLGTNIAAIVAVLSPVYRMALLVLGVLDEIGALFTEGRVGMVELAMGKDIDFSKAGVGVMDLLASNNPWDASKVAYKLYTNNDETFKDFNRDLILKPIQIEVKQEAGLETTINGVIARNNETQMIGGAP